MPERRKTAERRFVVSLLRMWVMTGAGEGVAGVGAALFEPSSEQQWNWCLTNPPGHEAGNPAAQRDSIQCLESLHFGPIWTLRVLWRDVLRCE